MPSRSATNAAIAPVIRVARIAVADAIAAKCREPGPGLPPGRAPVGRPEGDAAPPDKILHRHHSDPAWACGEAAVEAVVAVVAHQEHVAARDFRCRKIVRGPVVDLVEHRVGRPTGQASRDSAG